MISVKDIAENMKRLRVAKGMTQSDLGARLFVAPQTVSKWERGLSCPDVVQLGELADILDVPIRMLLERETDERSEAMIAIDGGGTKTEFVLFAESGEVLSRVLLSGSNPNAVGISASVIVLEEGIDALLAISGRVSNIYAGISGCGVNNNAARLAAQLRRRYPAAKITVESDIMNVIGSVENNKNCIAAIMGTGSSVFGWDGTTLRRAGGWGYIFDGAGSGYDIGREVIRKTLAYDDGLIGMCPMIDAAKSRIGPSTHSKILDIHEKGTSYIASFAAIAFEAARSGDEVALEIIRESADRIGMLIRHVAKDSPDGYEVVIAGGLCGNMDVLEPMITDAAGISRVTVPDLPQIFGAARRCLDMSEASYNFEEIKAKFKETYGEIIK